MKGFLNNYVCFLRCLKNRIQLFFFLAIVLIFISVGMPITSDITLTKVLKTKRENFLLDDCLLIMVVGILIATFLTGSDATNEASTEK